MKFKSRKTSVSLTVDFILVIGLDSRCFLSFYHRPRVQDTPTLCAIICRVLSFSLTYGVYVLKIWRENSVYRVIIVCNYYYYWNHTVLSKFTTFDNVTVVTFVTTTSLHNIDIITFVEISQYSDVYYNRRVAISIMRTTRLDRAVDDGRDINYNTTCTTYDWLERNTCYGGRTKIFTATRVHTRSKRKLFFKRARAYKSYRFARRFNSIVYEFARENRSTNDCSRRSVIRVSGSRKL